MYQGFRVSRDGSTIVFQKSDGTRPAELYAADAGFTNVRKLTDLNPWIAKKALPASELVSYRDADGKVLYGVLRYPVGYEKGRKYPTVFEIYETFFDNGFNGRAAMLAGQGYAVFHPSVNLVVGRPGESWAKGVTAAANKLIDMGVADPDRLGVHGTSYGGYATVLLLTETDRFKAADQRLGQGQHGQLLHRQRAARRAQHARAGEEPGPHRRHVVGISRSATSSTRRSSASIASRRRC